MKIHIDKQQTNEKTSLMQIVGLKKPTPCYEIYAWFELTPEELQTVNNSLNLVNRKLFDYIYERVDLSPTVNTFIRVPKPGEKGRRFVAYNTEDFLELEEQTTSAAKTLKNHIDGLKNSSSGSSTIEL